MKRLFILAVAALMATIGVKAQDELKHEIGVFYGVGSVSNVLSAFSSAFAAAAGEQSSWWGPIGVEYYYHVTPVVGVGGVAEYATCKAIDDVAHVKGLTETFISVMPSVKFNWLRKKHFGMYSGLSAGVIFFKVAADDAVKAGNPEAKDESRATVIFNATAVGAEFGGTAFRGFVEAGFGEKGVLCAGLRYKL
ncbi:MAG: hypothetical protein K5928_09475 [Prevotella sp.]|nr:hypothetical protein [Prevotella sp.]